MNSRTTKTIAEEAAARGLLRVERPAAVGGDVHRLDPVGRRLRRAPCWPGGSRGAPVEHADPERRDARGSGCGRWSVLRTSRSATSTWPVGRRSTTQDAADLAGPQQRDAPDPRRLTTSTAYGRFHVRIGDAARRHVEQAVGDARRPAARARRSLDTTAIRVTVCRSRYRIAIGASATIIARIASSDRRGEEERAPRPVAVLAPGDDPGVRQERVAARHQATPSVDSDSASRRRAPASASSSAGRPTCSMNSASRVGSTTSNRCTDDRAVEDGGEDGRRVRAGQRAPAANPPCVRPEPHDAGQLGQPGRRELARRPRAGASAGRWRA